MGEIRRLLDKMARQAVASEGEPGRLGLADGTLYYSDALGTTHYDRLWVTMGDSSEVVAVCTTGAVHQWGLPVIVGQRGGLPVVLRTDWAQAQRFTGGRPVGAGQHAWLHNRLGPDPLFLGGLQVPILVQPTRPASMAVHAPDIYYVYDSTRKHFAAAASASLSAYIPASTTVQHFAIVCLDRENNTLAVVDGADSAAGSAYSPKDRAIVPFDASDVAGVTIPAAYWPLVAIRFYDGQTAVQLPDIWLDAQPRAGEHLAAGDVSGPASSTDHAIVLFDGTGGKTLKDSLVTVDETTGTVVLYNSATRGVLNVTARSAAPSSPSAGDIYFDDGTNTTSGDPGLRRYTGTVWEDIGGGGGGASTFTGLSDVPSSYAGAAGQVVAVNSGETALEFITLTVSRQQITADLTYYVRTDGSDSNDGLSNSAGGAFATLQHAVDVASALDLANYDITLQIANGTYTEAVALRSFVGSGKVLVKGDILTPSNVVVSATSDHCFTARAVTGVYSLRGIRMQTTTSGYAIVTETGSLVEFENVDFGACASAHIGPANNSTLSATGNYSVSGGAAAHVIATYGGIAALFNRTVTFSTNPTNFSLAYVFATNGGRVQIFGQTYNNKAYVTGIRYDVRLNSTVYTNGGGATYLPGTLAGSTATGGQYA